MPSFITKSILFNSNLVCKTFFYQKYAKKARLNQQLLLNILEVTFRAVLTVYSNETITCQRRAHCLSAKSHWPVRELVRMCWPLPGLRACCQDTAPTYSTSPHACNTYCSVLVTRIQNFTGWGEGKKKIVRFFLCPPIPLLFCQLQLHSKYL